MGPVQVAAIVQRNVGPETSVHHDGQEKQNSGESIAGYSNRVGFAPSNFHTTLIPTSAEFAAKTSWRLRDLRSEFITECGASCCRWLLFFGGACRSHCSCKYQTGSPPSARETGRGQEPSELDLTPRAKCLLRSLVFVSCLLSAGCSSHYNIGSGNRGPETEVDLGQVARRELHPQDGVRERARQLPNESSDRRVGPVEPWFLTRSLHVV